MLRRSPAAATATHAAELQVTEPCPGHFSNIHTPCPSSSWMAQPCPTRFRPALPWQPAPSEPSKCSHPANTMAAADDSPTGIMGSPPLPTSMFDKDVSGVTIGIVGGSGLLKTQLPEFTALEKKTVSTEHGDVVLRVGKLPSAATLVFVQRHDARTDGEYTQPAVINYQAIALAMKAEVSLLGLPAEIEWFSAPAVLQPAPSAGRQCRCRRVLCGFLEAQYTGGHSHGAR